MSSSPIRTVKRYLCVKKLSVNDGFTNKSVRIPRAEGRFFMGELRNRQATPLVLLDEGGNCWELLCTSMGAQYALTRIGAFCEAHGARPGCYFIFYADHEHIVRLAVRQQLPEDVQAAVVAARAAAMAVRSGPQRVPQQQQPLPPAAVVSSSTASLPAGRTSQPVLDDPVALDEMPLSATSGAAAVSSLQASAVAATSAPGKPLAGPESPKSMPLQDRSNLPVGIPLSDAVGAGAHKPKPMGEKPNHAAPYIAANNVVGNPAADKENDATAFSGAGKAQPAGTPCPVVSTGGLQAPAPAASRNLQQQSTGLRPPPPSQQQHTPIQPSPQPSRSPPCQPPPSPATRLRLRFEARIRAQAGKLHPLSVRTGPDSPLPSPPGHCGAGVSYGAAWPSALPCAYTLQGGLYAGSGLLASSWGATGAFGNVAVGLASDWAPPDAHRRHGTLMPYSSAAVDGIITGSGAASGSAARQQQWDAAQGTAACAQQQPVREDWRQQLQCDEILDWEVGRRAACNAAVGLSKPPGFTAQAALPRFCAPPTQPSGLYPVGAPLAAVPNVHMGLLRQLLLLHGGNQSIQPLGTSAATNGQTDRGAAVGLGQPQQQPPRRHDFPEGPVGCVPDVQSAPLPAAGQEGLLASLAAANPTLRRLLSMSAAWDFAALSGAAGLLGQVGGADGRLQGHACVDAAQAPQLTRGSAAGDALCSQPALPRSAGDQPPDCGESDVDTSMDVDAGGAATAAVQEQGAQEDGGGGAQPKSRLSIERDARGAPAEPPSSKRPRATCRHLVASKALTAHDLLTDRVALSVAPAASALLASLLLLRGGSQVAACSEAAVAAGAQLDRGSGYPRNVQEPSQAGLAGTGASTPAPPEPEAHQQQVQHQLLGYAVNVTVEVLVETGAQYEGVLVLRGAGCTGASGREWELQGLRPYLIRRQAGVGDLLTLGVAETEQQTGNCLRLVAQLQQ